MAMAMGGEGGPPGTEMTGISFRDQLWLNSFPLERGLVFDYFALSPFYDRNCNNEQLRMKSIHPLDMSHLSKMTGIEYMLYEVQEPNLFVFRKQKRETPEKVTPTSAYYILDGSIYQAPNLHNVIGSRVVRALYHITKSFKEVVNKLEKIGYDKDSETEGQKTENKGSDETKKGGEVFNVKEAFRVDQILATIHRKLPPAPPPPPIMPVVPIENPAPGASAQNEATPTPTPALAPTPAQASAPPQTASVDASALGKQPQKSQPAEQPAAKRMKVERM